GTRAGRHRRAHRSSGDAGARRILADEEGPRPRLGDRSDLRMGRQVDSVGAAAGRRQTGNISLSPAPVIRFGTSSISRTLQFADESHGHLNADLDAIATYLAIGVRAPISPIPAHNVRAQLGRVIFEVQGCQNCHGGKNWTISAIDYTPPPAAKEVVDAQ